MLGILSPPFSLSLSLPPFPVPLSSLILHSPPHPTSFFLSLHRVQEPHDDFALKHNVPTEHIDCAETFSKKKKNMASVERNKDRGLSHAQVSRSRHACPHTPTQKMSNRKKNQITSSLRPVVGRWSRKADLTGQK